MRRRWNCSSCRASSASHERGEEITTNVGRFGPYVKYGAKYVSLKTDDPYTITPERALEVIREKEIADANRLILDFPDAGIQVLNGRYGPYITDKTRNAKIPKDRDPKSLALAECQSLLAARSAAKMGPQVRQGLGQGRRGAHEFQSRTRSRGARAARKRIEACRVGGSRQGRSAEARRQGLESRCEEARAGAGPRARSCESEGIAQEGHAEKSTQDEAAKDQSRQE